MRRAARVLAAFLGWLALACGGARQEADSLVRAMERFRRAENTDKPAAFDAVRATRCSAADVCRAQRECLAYAEPTAKALALKAEVEKALVALESDAMPKDSSEARALPGKLDEAERMLKEGMDHLEPCDNELLALKRAHRL